MMLIAQPNDPRVMNHLGHNDHVVLGLNDLIIVVVDDGHHRRTRAGIRGAEIPKQ